MSTKLSPPPVGRARPEILAPAGTEEMMRAAVENGADAIYFGLQQFNARLRANNFDRADLPRLMAWLHERGVKGYVTMNTLIFSAELPEAAETLRACSDAGVDAVLVQDLGLALLASRLAPELPIHASTQMTVTSAESVKGLEELGLIIDRVVAAREMSRKELRRMREDTEKEIEVFVHGAICVAYSGQCLTSEALGGRSANRGECAQACRLPYDLIVDGEKKDVGDVRYVLSPKDLAAYEDIGDLMDIGIVSLKIEGRLKTPHYVAATVQSYRAAIETALEGRAPRLDEPTRRRLEMTFSRGFTGGYLHETNHQAVVEGRYPKKRGLYLGTVKHVQRNGVVVRLEGPLKLGDGIVFDAGRPDVDEEGGRVYEMMRTGTSIRNFDPLTDGVPSIEAVLRFGEGSIRFDRIKPGQLLWKTSDQVLESELAASFAEGRLHHRRPVWARVAGQLGEPLALTLTDEDGVSVTVRDTAPAEQALKRPLTEAVLKDQLGRLGNTPFELKELSLSIQGDLMVPMSRLNDLRRRAVEELVARRRDRGRARPVAADALSDLRREAFDGRSGVPPLPTATPEETSSNPPNARMGALPSPELQRRDASATTKSGDSLRSSGELRITHGASLPHWLKGDAIQAVTFRLADSLPASALSFLQRERESITRSAQQAGRELTEEEKHRLEWLYSEKAERFLDAGAGSCVLAQDGPAEIVADALRHFDGERYRLIAWCVMPNHVHVLLRASDDLESILHSWKSFTAKKINALLGKTGILWQKESYDRLVRTEAELMHHYFYIWNNPEAARLKDWKWRYQIDEEEARAVFVDPMLPSDDAPVRDDDGRSGVPPLPTPPPEETNADSQIARMAELPSNTMQRRDASETINSKTAPSLSVLCRTMEQVDAAVSHGGVHTIYTDFEDIRLHKEARRRIPAGGPRFTPATIRVMKPGESPFVRVLLQSDPDAVLVRNLAAWHVLRQERAGLELIGDYSLNVANDLTAGLLYRHGLRTLTPSYDLNIDQLLDLLSHAPPEWFEVTAHQYMPMFHMEHCVFCRFLSDGTDSSNCGRPCESHSLSLRDRVGYEHPVKADAGCRNTVFNATAQSASEYMGLMREAGVRRFRIDFLGEGAAAVAEAIDAYLPVIRGETEGHDLWRRLRAMSKLGVTRGSLDHE